MEQKEIDFYIGVVSDFSMKIGTKMYCFGMESIEVKEKIRAWADEFTETHKQTDWEEVDYLEQILGFTNKKMETELNAPQIENMIKQASEDILGLNEILASDDDFEDFIKLTLGEMRKNDEILSNTGSNFLRAYLSGDSNGIILALTGWEMETLVKYYNEHIKGKQAPKLQCPQCGAEVMLNETTGQYTCVSCGQQWNDDIYVLVGYNEIDAFEDEETEEDTEIGYASHTSEDNSARYIPFDEYIGRLGKIPSVAKCYEVVTRPESQIVWEASDFEEKCEAIFDEVGLEAFGSMSCWAPVNWLKSFKENQK